MIIKKLVTISNGFLAYVPISLYIFKKIVDHCFSKFFVAMIKFDLGIFYRKLDDGPSFGVASLVSTSTLNGWFNGAELLLIEFRT